MSETVNFAVLGVGVPNQNLGGHAVYNGIGNVHAHFIGETPGAKLVACCDRNAEHGAAFAAQRGNDIHAISVCTPSGLHGDHAIQAVQAGKHVVVEKPLDIAIDKVDTLLTEVDRAGVKGAIVFPMRYFKGVNAVKDALDSGRLGTPAMIDGRCLAYRDNVYYQGWRGTWAMDGGGAVINQGIHVVDLLLYLFDDLESVQALWGTLGHDQAVCEVEDTLVAILNFRRGTKAVLKFTTCAYNDFGEHLDIYGMKGSVKMAMPEMVDWQMRDEPDFKFDVADYAENPEAFTGHRLLYADVVPYFKGDSDSRCAIHTGRRSVALVHALYESARAGGQAIKPSEAL
jgi:predicted dehydrogenase